MGTREKRECKSTASFGECLGWGKPGQALGVGAPSAPAFGEAQPLWAPASGVRWGLHLSRLPAGLHCLAPAPCESPWGGWVNGSPTTRWQIAR